MSLTIGNSIAARRSTRRRAQVSTLNRHDAKIRSTFLVLSCSALLATGIIVVMQRLNAPVTRENGSAASEHRTSSVENWVVATIPLQAPVTCCELIQNPDRYFSKITRVRAVLLGYHELGLYDPVCKGVDKYILADFDSASRMKLIKRIADLKGAGFKQGNFWAEVVLVGRFEKVKDTDVKSDAPPGDHQYIKYRYQLVVLDVEQVSALPPDMTWPP